MKRKIFSELIKGSILSILICILVLFSVSSVEANTLSQVLAEMNTPITINQGDYDMFTDNLEKYNGVNAYHAEKIPSACTFLNYTNLKEIASAGMVYANAKMNIEHDNAIVYFIPRELFFARGEYMYIGKEYGFYVKTTPYNGTGNYSAVNNVEVFIFQSKLKHTTGSVEGTLEYQIVPHYTYNFVYLSKYLIMKEGDTLNINDVTIKLNGFLNSDVIIPIPAEHYIPRQYDYSKFMTTKYVIGDAAFSASLDNQYYYNLMDEEFSLEDPNDNLRFYETYLEYKALETSTTPKSLTTYDYVKPLIDIIGDIVVEAVDPVDTILLAYQIAENLNLFEYMLINGTVPWELRGVDVVSNPTLQRRTFGNNVHAISAQAQRDWFRSKYSIEDYPQTELWKVASRKLNNASDGGLIIARNSSAYLDSNQMNNPIWSSGCLSFTFRYTDNYNGAYIKYGSYIEIGTLNKNNVYSSVKSATYTESSIESGYGSNSQRSISTGEEVESYMIYDFTKIHSFTPQTTGQYKIATSKPNLNIKVYNITGPGYHTDSKNGSIIGEEPIDEGKGSMIVSLEANKNYQICINDDRHAGKFSVVINEHVVHTAKSFGQRNNLEHLAICECGYSFFESHQYNTLTNWDQDGHTVKCKCNYTLTTSHDIYTSSYTNSEHVLKCSESDCGYQLNGYHAGQEYVGIDDNHNHQNTCDECHENYLQPHLSGYQFADFNGDSHYAECYNCLEQYIEEHYWTYYGDMKECLECGVSFYNDKMFVTGSLSIFQKDIYYFKPSYTGNYQLFVTGGEFFNLYKGSQLLKFSDEELNTRVYLESGSTYKLTITQTSQSTINYGISFSRITNFLDVNRIVVKPDKYSSLNNTVIIEAIAGPETYQLPVGAKVYNSIQSAINASNTGDTIFVGDGTYHENILINKQVTLKTLYADQHPFGWGMIKNYEFTVIQGQVGIYSDNSTINGFKITSNNTSGRLGVVYTTAGTSNVSIINNYITSTANYGTWTGLIRLTTSKSGTAHKNLNINNNYIDSYYGTGISNKGSATAQYNSETILYNTTIEGNFIASANCGIALVNIYKTVSFKNNNIYLIGGNQYVRLTNFYPNGRAIFYGNNLTPSMVYDPEGKAEYLNL